jgi:hypothetical protein
MTKMTGNQGDDDRNENARPAPANDRSPLTLNQRSGKLNRPSGINPGAFFFAYRSPRQISSSTRSSCSR